MRGAIRRSRVGEELGRLQRHSHAIRTQSARNQPFRHSHREPVVGEELGRLVREQHHEQHKAEQQTAGGTRVCKVHVPVGKGDGAVVSTGTQRQVISGNQRVLGDVRGHAPSRGSSVAINVVISGNQRGHQWQSTWSSEAINLRGHAAGRPLLDDDNLGTLVLARRVSYSDLRARSHARARDSAQLAHDGGGFGGA